MSTIMFAKLDRPQAAAELVNAWSHMYGGNEGQKSISVQPGVTRTIIKEPGEHDGFAVFTYSSGRVAVVCGPYADPRIVFMLRNELRACEEFHECEGGAA